MHFNKHDNKKKIGQKSYSESSQVNSFYKEKVLLRSWICKSVALYFFGSAIEKTQSRSKTQSTSQNLYKIYWRETQCMEMEAMQESKCTDVNSSEI